MKSYPVKCLKCGRTVFYADEEGITVGACSSCTRGTEEDKEVHTQDKPKANGGWCMGMVVLMALPLIGVVALIAQAVLA